jgi:hypothetical protein
MLVTVERVADLPGVRANGFSAITDYRHDLVVALEGFAGQGGEG